MVFERIKCELPDRCEIVVCLNWYYDIISVYLKVFPLTICSFLLILNKVSFLYICRANRLKQQRLERQKTATERRQTLESKQRERWKNLNHFECAQGKVLHVISMRLICSSEIISKRHSTTSAMDCAFQHGH